MGMPILILLCLSQVILTCQLQEWLPEFRGTYNDQEDAVIAEDWDAREEVRHILDTDPEVINLSSRAR